MQKGKMSLIEEVRLQNPQMDEASIKKEYNKVWW